MGAFYFMDTDKKPHTRGRSKATKTKRDYAQERMDPRWQKKRLVIMNRDDFACRECAAEDKTLNVHHRYYITGRQPWGYPDWSLVTLCRDCHELQHEAELDDDPNSSAWEDYLGWFDHIAPGEFTEEGGWCEMIEITKILTTAFSIWENQGTHCILTLREVRKQLQKQASE
jgi:hypothetical protein